MHRLNAAQDIITIMFITNNINKIQKENYKENRINRIIVMNFMK